VKKCIFLKQEYLDASKLKKADIVIAKDKIFQKSLLLFKKQMKKMDFKIIQVLSPNSVVVEYSEAMDEQMFEALRAAQIVEIIDGILPTKV
jgi:hypothetical protein